MRGPSETSLLHHGGRPGAWGSLGWWGEPAGDALDYFGACAALACRVGRAAGLNPSERVLSVACGAGEELRLWALHFRAAAVLGVEHSAAAAQQAADLVADMPGVQVLQGDGRQLLALGLPAASFDRVLCVDAAYHLHPQAHFLNAAFRLLRPGGTLAYTDLVLDEQRPAWRHVLLGWGARACGLAPAGLQDGAAQLQALRRAGFEAPQLQRIDEAVLGGFTRYAARQGRRLPGSPWQAGWRRVVLTAALIPPCRAAGLGYAMLSARKPLGSGAAITAAATASAEHTALSSNGTPASA